MKLKIDVISLEQSDIINILSGFMSYSSFWCNKFYWDDSEYDKAKEREFEKLEKDDVLCIEDVLSNILLYTDSPLVIEDEEGNRHDLTLQKLKDGVNLSIHNNGISIDVYDWDAVDTDVIIQNSIFNDVLYG